MRRALLSLTVALCPLLIPVGCVLNAADDGGRHLNDTTYWFGNSIPGGKGDAARWMMMGPMAGNPPGVSR